MHINYDAVSAWAAVIVALIAIVSVAVESRRAVFSRGVDVLLKYGSEFSGPEFRERRRQFAAMLRRKLDGQLTAKDHADFLAMATYFLDHYETIGYLLRRRVLDRQLTFVYYGYTFCKYWPFLKELIDECQCEMPTLWEDAVWLGKAFFRILKQPARNCLAQVTEAEKCELRSFIEVEVALRG
jgi:hypothetical protein